MIDTIQIANFKSISKLSIDLGRFNVLIGENGAGKSNILEAIGFGAAAYSERLDKEYLGARGIRVPSPILMKPGFSQEENTRNIKISIQETPEIAARKILLEFELRNLDPNYSNWEVKSSRATDDLQAFFKALREEVLRLLEIEQELKKKGAAESGKQQAVTARAVARLAKEVDKAFAQMKTSNEKKKKVKAKKTKREFIPFRSAIVGQVMRHLEGNSRLRDFAIYTPEDSALRKFEEAAQIEPLGIHGEGLFKLLAVLSAQDDKKQVDEIKRQLRVISWFDDFAIPASAQRNDQRLQVRDRYFSSDLMQPDQTSVNEGFLYLLFYYTLFSSDRSPRFFAVDNIDASLNPRLCEQLIQQLVALSKRHDKQVIVTTHNPAVLDGINLNDEEQRLFAVNRDNDGHTVIRRLEKPRHVDGVQTMRLSQAFVSGFLGALPKSF